LQQEQNVRLYRLAFFEKTKKSSNNLAILNAEIGFHYTILIE